MKELKVLVGGRLDKPRRTWNPVKELKADVPSWQGIRSERVESGEGIERQGERDMIVTVNGVESGEGIESPGPGGEQGSAAAPRGIR